MAPDPVTILALACLVGGILGSLLPVIPGGLVSLVGIYLYWWHSGYTEPGLLVLLVLTVLGVLAIAVDWLTPFASRASGASWGTSTLAGIVATRPAGPHRPNRVSPGLVVTVFFLRDLRSGEVDASAQAAVLTPIGVLGAAAIQILLTLLMLLGFILSVQVL
ncbi:MAG: DUF456 family protein [Natrialbaceae archaeon]|nr:DUF456 family protein [Natrialbaceae archaeon]